MPSQIPAWISVAAAIAAWIAATISFFNVRTARRSLRLAEAQEERRRPVLTVYLGDGYVRFLTEERARLYAFLLSVGNPSDTNNSVADLALRVNYVTRKGLRTSIEVPRSPSSSPDQWQLDASAILESPTKIDAHQTISGWVQFRIGDDLLGDGIIEDYVIVV